MDMQQVLEMLADIKGNQAKTDADRKADREEMLAKMDTIEEKRDADQEERKQEIRVAKNT
jgi:hypothetical protein